MVAFSFRTVSVIKFLPAIPTIALSPLLLEFKCFRTASASSQMSSSTQSAPRDRTLLRENDQHIKEKWFSVCKWKTNQKKHPKACSLATPTTEVKYAVSSNFEVKTLDTTQCKNNVDMVHTKFIQALFQME